MKTFVIGIFSVFVATAAAAQDKGYVQGVGGFTFQSEVSGLFGGEFGVNVTKDVVIYGQVGRMLNILPKSAQDDLDDAAQTLTAITGDHWEFDGKVPATYFGGGVKFMFPTGTSVRPYVLGGVGMVNMKGSIKEIDYGEILDDLVDEGFISEDDVKGTEFAFEFGGGLVVGMGRVQVDAGYRFMKVNAANVSRVIGGLGVRF